MSYHPPLTPVRTWKQVIDMLNDLRERVARIGDEYTKGYFRGVEDAIHWLSGTTDEQPQPPTPRKRLYDIPARGEGSE